MTRIDRTNLEQLASDLGADHGRSAAGWWEQEAIGGRATGDTRTTAQRVLEGIRDGDPAIYDALPYADLSGEWADGYTPRKLAEDLGDPALEEEEPEELDRLCDVYADAFASAARDAVERECLRALEPDRDWQPQPYGEQPEGYHPDA